MPLTLYERNRQIDDWRWREPGGRNKHNGIVSIEEWGGECAVPPRAEELVWVKEVCREAGPVLLSLCEGERLSHVDQCRRTRERGRMRRWRDAQ